MAGDQTQYHIAWGLILVNIGVQYFIELRNHKNDEWHRGFIKRMGSVLIFEAAFVFAAAVPDRTLGFVCSCLAIVIGIVFTVIIKRNSVGAHIDFAHLSERVMLFVVFTFGEMIIAVASYFTGDGSFNLNTIYFSLMAFLIVVGLFLSYGLVYDHFINREGKYNGMIYMALHIFIIFFLNNITASLEFMREEDVAVLPKMIFLICSIIGYFLFLFSLKGYVKNCDKVPKSTLAVMVAVTALFAVVMILLREFMKVNIFLTVIYMFIMVLILLRAKRLNKKMTVSD